MSIELRDFLSIAKPMMEALPGSHIDKKAQALWITFKDEDAQVIREACKRSLEELEFFPTPIKFKAIVLEIRARDKKKRTINHSCKDCDSIGIICANGYAYRCHCVLGSQYPNIPPMKPTNDPVDEALKIFPGSVVVEDEIPF